MPRNLTPQSWLTEMLLGQIYRPENEELRKLIYGEHEKHKVDASFKNARGKLITFHPKHKNNFEEKLPSLAPSNFSKATAAASAAWKFLSETNPKMRYAEFLLNMTPAQHGALIPYMAFFTKTRRPAAESVRDKPGHKNQNPWQRKDIIFKEFVDEEFILNNQFARIGSAGIKQMTVKRNFPSWGLSNSFFFDVEFYFSSMKAFAEGHPIDLLRGWSKKDYLKLIIPKGQRTKCDGFKTVEVLEEQLYVEYGWKFKKDTPDELVPFDVRQVFEEEERKVFNIRWTKHDFKFGENGEINLNVSYQGAPEFTAYAESEKNDVLEIVDLTKIGKISVEKKTIKATMDELKDLKEEAKKVENFFSDCSGVEKRRRESLSADVRKEEDELIEEIKKEGRSKILFLNKRINRIKKATALTLQQIILEIIAHENQLFKVSFSQHRSPGNIDPSFVLNTAVSTVTSRKSMKAKALSDIKKLGSSGASKQALSEYLRKSGVTISKDSEFKLDEVVDEISAIIKEEKIEGKYILRLLNGGDIKAGGVDYKKELEKRLHAMLCALTNCGHGAGTKTGGLGQVDRTFGNFMFFPLKALISAMFELLGEEKRNAMPTVAFGNMIIRAIDKEMWVNIGDVLIEVSVYKEWFFKHVESVGRSKWTFGNFMDSVVYDLMPNALRSPNTNFGNIVKEPYKIGFKTNQLRAVSAALSAEPSSNSEASRDALVSLSMEIKKKDDETDTSLFYYRQKSSPSVNDTEAAGPLMTDMGQRTFNRWKDHSDGMYHLVVGEDRGILTQIDFSYMDNSALRTALWLDTLVDSAAKFLKQPYESTPTMIGNNLFDKGRFFVISHNPLGISDVDDPGIRGYYRIDSVTDVISVGKYTTSVHGVNMGHNFDEKKNTNPEQGLKAKKAKFGIHAEHNIVKYITESLILDEKIANLYFSKKVKFKHANELPTSTKECKGVNATWNEKQQKCICTGGNYFINGKCMNTKEATEYDNQLKKARKEADKKALEKAAAKRKAEKGAAAKGNSGE